MLVVLALAAALAQEQPADAARRVRGLANGRLALVRRVISDPDLVRAIVAKNKATESQADVKRTDEDWQRDPEMPRRREITSNDCAVRLKALVQEDPSIADAYLMDNRGTLVCSVADVPDYWQGDEPNFQRTFGQGQFLFVGEPVAAETAGAWSIPISMVVLDGPTKVGAATLVLKVSPEMLAPPATPTPVTAAPPVPPPGDAPLAPTPTPPPSPVP